MCIGVRCDLCDEMACRDDMRAREGLRVCPVCRFKLGLTEQDVIPMMVAGIDHSRYPFRVEDYR